MFDNVVRLIGFVGSDAKLKTTKAQREYTVLSLATTASWKEERPRLHQAHRLAPTSRLYGVRGIFNSATQLANWLDISTGDLTDLLLRVCVSVLTSGPFSRDCPWVDL